jgi:hypothetical protein
LHTVASDGAGTHREVAEAAIRAGLDFIVFTDHNVCLPEVEGWHRGAAGDRQVLLLMGEEVNDRSLQPEVNHLLCYAIGRNVADLADDPQRLIDAVNRQDGVCFLAHPLERPGLGVNEPAIPWVRWDADDYLGLELWNYMSEAKSYMHTRFRALLCAFWPAWHIRGPFPETLAKWDSLMKAGRKVVVIGNADAHANVYSMGPLRRAVYPYEYLFRAVNTHLLLTEPLGQTVSRAAAQIRDVLRAGRCFVAYDLIGDARGFRFSATDGRQVWPMGAEVVLEPGRSIQLEISAPRRARLTLFRNGRPLKRLRGQRLTHGASEAGVYRVEAHRRYRLRWRGWVYTNPIYVRLEEGGYGL